MVISRFFENKVAGFCNCFKPFSLLDERHRQMNGI